MAFRERTISEIRAGVVDRETHEAKRDPLFEREWEVLVVKRDPETGEYRTETVSAEQLKQQA
jgi:hypothetical protein